MSEVNSTNSQSVKVEKYNRWTVIGPGKSSLYRLCECGCPAHTRREVNIKNLRSGASKSCGCHKLEGLRKRQGKMAAARVTHGMSRTPEYQAWAHLKDRCLNPKSAAYKDYGGRGITVCDRYRESFEAVFADLGPRPSNKHSIDRIDNEKGGYWCGKPECSECGPLRRKLNCRWGTEIQQQRNRRNNRIVQYEGKPVCVAELSEKCGIPANVLERRLTMKWDLKRAMTEPVHKKDILSYEQVKEIRRRYVKGSWSCGAPALAKEFGVGVTTIQRIVSNPETDSKEAE